MRNYLTWIFKCKPHKLNCVEKLMAAIYLPRCTNDIDRVDVEKGKQSINW